MEAAAPAGAGQRVVAVVDSSYGTSEELRALAAEQGRPVGAGFAELAAAAVRRLRHSAAREVVVDLDDAFGVTEPHNRPGTVDDANWSRRAHAPVEELARDPRLARVLGDRPVDAEER